MKLVSGLLKLRTKLMLLEVVLKKLNVKSKGILKRESTTLISALCSKGILGGKLIRGTVTAKIFKEFAFELKNFLKE